MGWWGVGEARAETRRGGLGARARGALDGAHGPAPMRRIVIDLELEEGAEAARPILLD